MLFHFHFPSLCLNTFHKSQKQPERKKIRDLKRAFCFWNSGVSITLPTFHLFPLFHTELIVVFSALLMSCDFVAFHTRW